MNDAAFSNYYSGANGMQHPHTDLSLSISTPMHTVEDDNYNNCSYFEEEHSFLVANTSLPPPPLPQFGGTTPTHRVVQEEAPAGNYDSIPFVRIHTTDLHQQAQSQKSYRNAFRRKTAEIKSELIKSEQADASKERTNATPTPPTRNSSCASMEGKTTNEEVVEEDAPSLPTQLQLPTIHKCPNCPFLSLSQLKVQTHIANCFGADVHRCLQCPGCENVFFSIDALNVHLSEDHQMEVHEVSSLLFALNQLRVSNNSKTTTVMKQQQQPPKSRIFIKNVDCLREPQRECAPHDIPQLTAYMPQDSNSNSNNTSSIGNILDLLDSVEGTVSEQRKPPDVPEPTIPRQKISIKSVDVLREPALLPFDFPLPTDNQQQQHQPTQLPFNAANDNALDAEVVQEKPRAPKIYIRNVDILKEAMLLPSTLSSPSLPSLTYSVAATVPNSTDIYGGGAELLPPTTTLPGFEAALSSLSNVCNETFSFDTVLNGNGNANANVNSNGLDSFSVSASNSSSNTSNGNSNGGNFVMDTTRFSALDLDFGVDFENTVPQVPIMTEPTPPPPPVLCADPIVNMGCSSELDSQSHHFLPQPVATATSQKQKIFIKNVDILKAPQFQQRHEQQQHQHQQRGTLHLRTVDELNLMNRNEVEHLIAPHMDHILDLPVQSSWPGSNGYDLADDLDCIIINTIAPLLPVDGNVETLQLPAAEAAPFTNNETVSELDTLSQMAAGILIDDFDQLYVPQEQSCLKNEWPAAGEGNLLDNSSSGEETATVSSSSVSITDDVPPLVPVTTTTRATDGDICPQSASNLTSLPVPPLVPCAAPKPVSVSSEATNSAGEKQARIYVANNLLPSSTAVEPPALVGGTSVRGRPYGAKRTGNPKPRKPSGSSDAQSGIKCTVNGCVFRFKSPTTLEYHRRCHNGAVNSAQPMICPECQSKEFSNWNSLHTHLWRTHQIDMELYCCQLCSFKTPIYSRLVNTHSKIHSDERNYKCEQCGKAFKNTKQLKNHRRLHRTQGLGKTGVPESQTTVILHRCEDCGAAFSHVKTLREHLCKQRNESAQCELCQRVVSSKSSLKLHMLTHQKSKRFKCDDCDYTGNDHNAFRRHKATHQDQCMYACPHCEYKAIQSTVYQLHIQQKHPEHATKLLHFCNICSFTTVNASLLLIHQAKHETLSIDAQPQEKQATKERNASSLNQSKIKLESSLQLSHSTVNSKKPPTVAQVPTESDALEPN